MSDLERRFTAGRVELRAGSEKRTFGGYAAKFNTPSKNLGGFIEQIAPTFFNRSRSRDWPDVIARYNHDDNMLLGTTNAGTLRLSLDEVGLVYEVDPPQSRQDVFELVERGDVAKSSFAFIADEDDWDTNDQGFPMRTLVNGRLIDVAPVNIPAYDDTTARVRSVGGELVIAADALDHVSVALRSLAKRFEAEETEVRKLAQANELIKFFKRTDGSQAPAKRSAAMRLAQVKAIEV